MATSPHYNLKVNPGNTFPGYTRNGIRKEVISDNFKKIEKLKEKEYQNRFLKLLIKGLLPSIPANYLEEMFGEEGKKIINELKNKRNQMAEKTKDIRKESELKDFLLDKRTIFFNGEFNEDNTKDIILKLFYLENNQNGFYEDINLIISSCGGICDEANALIDIIKNMKCKVNTIGLGKVYSNGANLLIAGTGTRSVTKNTNIMFHSVQSNTGYESYEDRKINNKNTSRYQKISIKHIQNNCKNKLSKKDIKKMLGRDFYVSPKEAIKLGLIDKIQKEIL